MHGLAEPVQAVGDQVSHARWSLFEPCRTVNGQHGLYDSQRRNAVKVALQNCSLNSWVLSHARYVKPNTHNITIDISTLHVRWCTYRCSHVSSKMPQACVLSNCYRI